MDNYLGEIRPFAFGRIPKGWHICDGTLLSIQENSALYSLIGTTFGSMGGTQFAIPDLRGRVIVGGSSNEYFQGYEGGYEFVKLTNSQINHDHLMHVEATLGETTIPTNMLAIPDVTSLPSEEINIYAINNRAPTVALNPETISSQGGDVAHYNVQPYLAVNYCIALTGIYPSRW